MVEIWSDAQKITICNLLQKIILKYSAEYDYHIPRYISILYKQQTHFNIFFGNFLSFKYILFDKS